MARFISTLGYTPPTHISVLILTDDVAAGRELSMTLQAEMVTTRSAPAKRLERMLAAAIPEAFVIDWSSNGAESLQAARRYAPDVPIIAVAPGPTFDERKPLIEAGVEHVLWHPQIAREIAMRARVAAEAAAKQRATSAKFDAMRLSHDWVRYLVHDLRNPVTVAMYAVSHALDAGTEEAASALQDADRALGEVTQMLRDILDTDRIKHGALAPMREEVDLAQLAHDATGGLITHPISITSEGNTSVVGDPVLLRRVIGNLVTNASKHVRVRPVEVRVIGTEHGVSARVVNDGPGIDPAIRPHLFEPWQHVSGLKAGTGIGLAFCRLVCEAHGGSIWLDSGTEGEVAFAFGLPRMTPISDGALT